MVLAVKDPPANASDARHVGLIAGSGRSPGEGNGNPLQYSCLENPWREEPDRLQAAGWQRVGHDWATSLSLSLGDQVLALPWSLFYSDHCGYSLSKLLQQKLVESNIWFPPKWKEAGICTHQLPSIIGWDLFPGTWMLWHFDLPRAWGKRKVIRKHQVLQ